MAVFNIQNHFNTGWVSPAWAARADSQERFNGLLRADNLVFPPQGGCHKRPVLRVLAKATGVERIFRWHRNEREKFVVGVDGDGAGRIYNTEFGLPDEDSPAIDGSLSFNSAGRLNAFHHADTLIITDGENSPQEIVLQDRAALIAANQVRTINERGITLTAIPDTIPDSYPGVSFTLRVGTESQLVAASVRFGSGTIYYGTTATIGGIEYVIFFSAPRNQASPTWSVQLRTSQNEEYIPLDTNIQIDVMRESVIDEVALVAEATGISPEAQAEGFEARTMTINNPPMVRLSEAEYNKAVMEGSAVASNCVNIPPPDSPTAKPAEGKTGNRGKVITWNGTALTTADPGDGEVGFPPGRWCMRWNDRDGYPVVAGFRDGRLVFAGNNGSPAALWFSTIGGARDFLQARAEPVEDNLLGLEVASDYGLERVLDSFERVVALYSDNGLVVFTEGGEWSIQGGFDAAEVASAVARKYSNYGSVANIGVAVKDRQLFFVAGKAVFALLFQGDDLGYDPINLTNLRNEDVFGDSNAVRMVAALPPDQRGANTALILTDGGAGDPFIVAHFTERATRHAAWAKWTFPRHRIIDITEVDNEFFVLADELSADGTAVVRRVVARLEQSGADTIGEAGDEVEGGYAAFECAFQTPDLINPFAMAEGWINPKACIRLHMKARAAGGEEEQEEVKVTVGTDEKSFRNFEGDPVERVGGWRGQREVDIAQFHKAQLDEDAGLSATISVTNLLPLHLYWLIAEMEVEITKLR